MLEFREPVFYVPGTSTIIDTAVLRDGVYLSAINGHTLQQLRLEYPNAEVGEWDDVYRAVIESCKTEPQEITKDQFIYALEVLPPVGWRTAKGVDSFKISERLYANITAIYARIGKRFFTFNDSITLSAEDIAVRIANSRAFKRPPVPFLTLKEFRELNPNFHHSEKEAERDFDILTSRIKKLNEHQGRPRVGDFVIYPDTSERRFTHDWSDVGGGLQTTCPTITDGSFYLTSSGRCDFSGALDDPLPLNELEETNEFRLGAIWFFSNDQARAHNGVRAKIPFRVYRYKPAALEP